MEKEEIDFPKFHQVEGLIVEDNERNEEIEGELLKILGIEFDQATNGQDALNMFIHSKQNYYRLILMDVRMPIMNGYDATRNIRGLERDDAKIIPIIAMTAATFSSDVRMAHTA